MGGPYGHLGWYQGCFLMHLEWFSSTEPNFWVKLPLRAVCSDKKDFYHFCTHFFKIGGVLFWQRENFSSKISWFYNKNHIQVLSVDLKCHFLYIVTKIYLEIWIFNQPLKLKSSKKSQNQVQSLQIWCYILEKKIWA